MLNTLVQSAANRPPLRALAVLLVIVLLMVQVSGAFGQAAADEITVTHAQGETGVKVNPASVLTFDLATLSTLHVLGIAVSGVPDFAFPEALAQYADDDYLKIGSLFEPDYETVAAAAPDLIIVSNRSAAVYPQLAAIAPTVDLSSDWTDFLASHQQNAEIIGQIFGVEDEVAELWAAIEEQVAEVQALTADAGTALIVMVSGGEVTAYGTGSRFGWIHEELGFTPVIEDIQEATHGEAISFEFILEANPDWLIVIDRDVAVGEQAESAVNVLDNELVAQTSAWQNGQVIYLDPSNWYVVMGGLGAIQEMVDEIALALDPDAAADAKTETETEAGS
jgi:iron complex transport system substrate-binding protein